MPKKKKPAKFNLDRRLQANNQDWYDIYLRQHPKVTEPFFRTLLSEISKTHRDRLLAALPPDITGDEFKKMDEWITTQPHTGEVRGATVAVSQASVLWHLCEDAQGRLNPKKVQIAFHAMGTVLSCLYGDDWHWIMYDARRGRDLGTDQKRNGPTV